MTDDDIVKRFNERVDRRQDDECWPWTGSVLKKDRRGVMSIDHKNVTAPRISWFVHHGCWPTDGMFVCHTCDNPNCVNHQHLWLGTNKDNLRDAASKNRIYTQNHSDHIKGSKHGNAKLTEELVMQARKEYKAGGISIRKLAAKYGVTYGPMQLILSGERWKHV